MADRPNTDPDSENFAKGPAVGDVVPGFTLPDQTGKPVQYAPDGKTRSLILFHRSADW